MPRIISFSCYEEVPQNYGEDIRRGLGYTANASEPDSGWLPSHIPGVSGVEFSVNIISSGTQDPQSMYTHLDLKYFLSFFDSLVSDLPANPTQYDGMYSFSSTSGAYHMIGGILENPDNKQRYLFFCVKRASSSFVLISPPYPIKEVIQMTSRYANMWIGNPGTPLSQGQMPTQYCHLATMEEGSGVAGLSEFKNLTIQVFHDWVAFSGEVGGVEEVNLLIEIKRIPEMTVVKTLSGTTTGRRFYLDTHLPPGEYTYEAYAYTSSSGSTGGGEGLSGGSGTGEGESSSDSGDSEWGGIELM